MGALGVEAGDAAQQENADALRADVAVRGGVQGLAAPVWRQHACGRAGQAHQRQMFDDNTRMGELCNRPNITTVCGDQVPIII